MTAHSRYGRLFEERATERIGELLAQMGNGTASDYPAYRQLVGRIEGIKDALKISEELDSELTGA